MHDHNYRGAGKPVQSRSGSLGPEPKRSRRGLENSTANAPEMGARVELSEGEETPRALADSVPAKPAFFNFDAQAVRVVGTWDRPLFVASDLCAALGIQNVSQAINGNPGSGALGLDDDEKGVCNLYTLGGPQQMLCVTESGMYALIFRSKKPSARIFRRWVTTEVLPSIRKSGRYEAPRPLVIELTPPAPGGHGHFAMLELPSGRPAPDLATEHFSTLLHTTLGDSAGEWSGRLDDLIRVARANHLFWWILRDPADLCQRVAFGVMLRRRIGIVYAGYACTKLRLHALGRNRHRKYLITREGGALS